MHRGSIIALALAISMAPHSAGAESVPAGPDLERSGWKTLTFPGITPTRFAGLPDGGVELTAIKSSALLYRPLPSSDGGHGTLAWEWRVDRPIPATDLTRKGVDDRPLALHIWFPDTRDEADFFDRIGRFIVKDIFGVPLSGMVLTYVWGGKQAPGESFVNPHTGPKGMMIVLRNGSAESGRWYQEQVDFAADFARVFGHPAPAPSFIALSADSDDSGAHSVGQVRDLRLLQR